MEPERIRKNDVLEALVTGFAHDGAGVARAGGTVLFIPGAAPGDRLLARVIKPLKNRAVCRIEKIISPSPDRIENTCPAFPACGGCDFRHISYAAELEIKRGMVKNALSRLGGLSVPEFEIVPAPCLSGYRNKAMYPFGTGPDGRIIYGFYRSGSHKIVPCPVPCGLHPEFFDAGARALVRYMELTGQKPFDGRSGSVRCLYLRYGEISGEVCAAVVSAKRGLPEKGLLVSLLSEAVPGLSSVVLNFNPDNTNTLLGAENEFLLGGGRVSDTLCGVLLSVSHMSFYQVNRRQCEVLYQTAAEYVRGGGGKPRALELFCGAGAISLVLSPFCEKVLGIEIVPEAVDDARANAAANGIGNAEFYAGDAAAAPEILKRTGFAPDAAVVDPPRKGLSPEVTEFLASGGFERIVYVSCDPGTLARDLGLLSARGYSLEALKAVDMFPRTRHVECVVLMSRVKD